MMAANSNAAHPGGPGSAPSGETIDYVTIVLGSDDPAAQVEQALDLRRRQRDVGEVGGDEDVVDPVDRFRTRPRELRP
jgi:hypothetical protein